MVHAVNEDTFRLVVGGAEVPIVSTYTVNAGVFEVPAQFDMTVGHSGLLVDLLRGFALFTPFELFVNETRVMQGEIDELTGTGGNKTELKVTGFDRLYRLTTTEVDSDRSFTETTYAGLTEIAMAEVGLGDVSLVRSNLANRKAITGSVKSVAGTTAESKQTPTPQAPAVGFKSVNGQLVPFQIPQPATSSVAAAAASNRAKVVLNSLTIESGTTWWDFLIAQYARGGLFLWADVFGGFVLGTPDGKQPPLYRIVRRRGGAGEPSEVTFLGQPDFQHSARGRYTEFRVHGRKGSGPNGRGQAEGSVFDDEMIALLGKRPKIKIYVDDKAKTAAQAKFLALRRMAESRRNGCSLSYTVSGHTVNALSGGGRLVWQPDTVVHVIDDDLGIDEHMYLDSCSYNRGPKSTTRLHLMRTEDLLFGEEDLSAIAKPVARKKGFPKIIKEEFHAEFWHKDPNGFTSGQLPQLKTIDSTGNFKKPPGKP